MKLQLTPLITDSQTKASALGLTDDAFYELMTHPSAGREAVLDSYEATFVNTTSTAYFSV